MKDNKFNRTLRKWNESGYVMHPDNREDLNKRWQSTMNLCSISGLECMETIEEFASAVNNPTDEQLELIKRFKVGLKDKLVSLIGVKYAELQVVKLKARSEEYDNCVLLMHERNKNDELVVELTGDCWFQEHFEVVEIHKRIPVNTLQDVYNYCKQHGIEINSERLSQRPQGLLAGGEKDFLINNNLIGTWCTKE